MGKCTRKPRTSGDVSAMDVSQSSLGVRTRAKMLALQRLQSSAAAAAADDSPQPPKTDYLELRSRRLEKLPPLRQCVRNPRNTPASEQSIVEENPRIESLPQKASSGSGISNGRDKDEDDFLEGRSCGFEAGDSEIEVSLGENNLDMDVLDRTTRESTPCSLIRAADTVEMPGSSTKHRSSAVTNQSLRDSLRIIPTAHEIEEFFALMEQPQQRQFVEKYNFDILNDMPLPGRFEWVRVTPCAE